MIVDPLGHLFFKSINTLYRDKIFRLVNTIVVEFMREIFTFFGSLMNKIDISKINWFCGVFFILLIHELVFVGVLILIMLVL